MTTTPSSNLILVSFNADRARDVVRVLGDRGIIASAHRLYTTENYAVMVHTTSGNVLITNDADFASFIQHVEE